MSKNRVKLVRIAFQKMDRDGNGKLTVEDLRGLVASRRRSGAPTFCFVRSCISHTHLFYLARTPSVYDVRGHPKFKTGVMDEDQVLGLFLASFDTPGQADGTVCGASSVSFSY